MVDLPASPFFTSPVLDGVLSKEGKVRKEHSGLTVDLYRTVWDRTWDQWHRVPTQMNSISRCLNEVLRF